MAHLLGGENLHLEFPTKTVFDSVSLGIDEGDRIGIVGRNGDGKSTLMKLLAGRLKPDGGRVTVRSGVRVGMLDQADVLDPELTVGHAVVGDREEHEWAGDAKVRDVISGLVKDLDWDAKMGELSGGQKRRVALAALLAGDWDVIFLDEPTNHLDVDGITWLARHLNNRWPKNQGGLAVVTHDRWFLDAVCTDTWEVHDRMVEPFEGGYAAYVLQRVERDRQASTIESKRQNLMKKELAWLRRGAPARTAKPKFRIEAANQLINDVPPPRDTVALSQLAVSRLGKDVVDLEKVSVSYPTEEDGPREVLRDVTWLIAPGERTGILGVNGAGKSTLLGLVTGEVQPTSGRVKRGKTVKIATLTQQLSELEDVAEDRVSDVVASKRSTYLADGKEMTPGQLLERLGFTNEQLATPVKDLSGGQKRRLQLLMILLDEPNVLILDEPSNDLDTDMLAAMEDVLEVYHRPHDPARPLVCLDETSKQLVAETRRPRVAFPPGATDCAPPPAMTPTTTKARAKVPVNTFARVLHAPLSRNSTSAATSASSVANSAVVLRMSRVGSNSSRPSNRNVPSRMISKRRPWKS